jgi:aspartyl-tRNA(Asn)/glutamyl-tRNA(Gln) amidotransferase subunit C
MSRAKIQNLSLPLGPISPQSPFAEGILEKEPLPVLPFFKPSLGDPKMKISGQEVEHVALLARLKFSEAEKERFTTQLNNILEYMDKLKELDTSQVEPTFHAVTRKNIFREDQVLPSSPQDLTLSNAPDGDRGFFRVPKIIE